MHSLSKVRSAIEGLGFEVFVSSESGNFAFRVGATQFQVLAFATGDYPAKDGKGREGGPDTIVVAREGNYETGPTDYLIGAENVIKVLKEDIASAKVFQGS